jgi:NAD(P)-dependent dehydrogenase (short-subunit alcohol dehydrogenase family)
MDQAKPQRVVVMTGVTAGLGAHAVHHIAAQPDTRVIIGARGSGPTVPHGVAVLPLDLASLDSVRDFADAVTRQLGAARIDSLVLNAGMQTANAERRSADGYELTFAVNHLAHYLLARLLVPRMADHGRLVITTSDTHDPAVTPIAPTTLAPQALAQPEQAWLGRGHTRLRGVQAVQPADRTVLRRAGPGQGPPDHRDRLQSRSHRRHLARP